jgi:hypothetical protein
MGKVSTRVECVKQFAQVQKSLLRLSDRFPFEVGRSSNAVTEVSRRFGIAGADKRNGEQTVTT